jgi:hypothetical protein
VIRWVSLVAVMLCTLLAAGPASAHGRSTSWSTWTVRGRDVDVRVRVSRLDLSAHPRLSALSASAVASDEDERALADYLERSVRVEADGGSCAVDPRSHEAVSTDEGFVVRTWRTRCEGAGRLRITSDFLFEQLGGHVHFVTVARDGAPVVERVLTDEARSFSLGDDASPAVPSGLVDFVKLGVHHVLTGADHLVFILTLLAIASSLRAVAGLVTGFTIGHSATLALAVLGGVRPDTGTVEALVGASIAVVAVENVWLERRDPWVTRALLGLLGAVAVLGGLMGRGGALALAGLALFVGCYFGLLARSDRPARLRWAVAALFGTVHGLAFSGVLAEMALPRARLAGALFGFNVGVEVAQLGVVALAWPLWRLVARSSRRVPATTIASATALAAGVFWLVDRTLG